MDRQRIPDNTIVQCIITFARILRNAGIEVSTGQVLDAVRALALIGMRSRNDVYQALSCVCVSKREHVDLFKQAFYLFWRNPTQLPELMNLLLSGFGFSDSGPSKRSQRVQQAIAENDNSYKRAPKARNRQKEAVDVILTYSPAEVLRKKDFAAFSTDEISLAKEILAKMEWSIDEKKTRRFHADSKGRLFDLRRTIQKSLRYRGELVTLSRRDPRSKPRDLTVLCDISGSMERYSRMLLHFLHTITGGRRNVETFVFGTHLTRITRALRSRDIDDAVTAISHLVNDWSGGTRIGESVEEFNFVWARRTLRNGAIVLLISDGWDRGDIPLLEREMGRLSRNCSRLIWLNPHLGYEKYQPLTRGMRAALPFVDDFLPVHNLESLQQLGTILAEARAFR